MYLEPRRPDHDSNSHSIVAPVVGRGGDSRQCHAVVLTDPLHHRALVPVTPEAANTAMTTVVGHREALKDVAAKLR